MVKNLPAWGSKDLDTTEHAYTHARSPHLRKLFSLKLSMTYSNLVKYIL